MAPLLTQNWKIALIFIIIIMVGIFVCVAGSPGSLYLTLDLVWKCVRQPTLVISCVSLSHVSHVVLCSLSM